MSDVFSFTGCINDVVSHVNDWLWTYILVGLLLACALLFTIKTRGVQFRLFGEMIRLLGDSTQKEHKQHVSSFEAFAVSIASRVGTGNLAGVATAIAVGGPGAVFWMWVVALLGSATAFVESTLAQLYKRPASGSFVGGPAYYMQYGLRKPWMAKTFAVLITATFCMAYVSVQSNTICGAMDKAFGIPSVWMGGGLVLLSSLCVFGGIQRIAKVSSLLVPVMAVLYILLAVYVIFTHITLVPKVFGLIVSDAFGLRPFSGGTFGVMLMTGVKRGLFSNEAGEGSAACAASIANVSHPVKQGLVQALSVLTDTLLICSCTAFIILLSGVYTDSSLNGIQLTQTALQSEVGAAGPSFVAIAIFLFAFSSIIGNYTYGEMNVKFLTQNKRWLLFVRLMNGAVMVFFGAMANLDLVWSLGDLFMGFVTLCNLAAILLLHPQALWLLRDYQRQKKQGVKSPKFLKSKMPGGRHEELTAWE